MWSDSLYHYSLLQILYKYRYIIACTSIHLVHLYTYFTYIYGYISIYMYIGTFPNVFLKLGSSLCLEFSFMYFTCLIGWEISLFFLSIRKEKSALKQLEQCLHHPAPLFVSPARALYETHRDPISISLSSIQKYIKNNDGCGVAATQSLLEPLSSIIPAS